jgi:hypothetical protein
MGWVNQVTRKVNKAVTDVTQPIEKAVTAGVKGTSKNLIPAELQGVLGNFMGGSGGTDILGGISKSVTDVLQPVEKVVNKVVAPVSKAATEFVQDPSKATTNALQPVEKVVNYIGANPNAQLALAMAVAVPVVGEYIGAELMAAGAITSAEAASAAAIASGATAAQAAAAASAATAAATAIGTAIASTTAQVAQGVSLEKAIENTATNAAVSQLSPVVAKQLDGFINSSAVKNAITSTVTSGAATAAKGGSQADIEKAMTAGLAGSAASSAYQSVAQSAPDIYSKTIGGATAGAVTGGTEGAVIGGLSSAAGALGSNLAKPTPKPADTAALPPSEVAALGGAVSPDATSQSDVDTGQASIEIPPAPVAGLDLTKDQQILDLIAEKPAATDVAEVGEVPPTPDKTPITAPPVEVDADIPRVEVSGVGNIEPPQGAFLPDTAPTPEAPDIPAADPMSQDPAQKAADKQILDLISETPTEDQVEEVAPDGTEKGAYLPDSGTDTKTTTYKPDLFTTTYLSPKTRTVAAPTSALGSALGTTGLTSYRGAGEIEGTGSGKPRKKVWNEESLKLKDALGV